MASSSHAYLQPFSVMQHAVKSSRMDVVEGCFWGRNCCPSARVTGQGNHFEFIPAVSMESQHSTGGPTCHDFPRFVIILEKSIPEVGNHWRKSPTFWGFLGEKRPLTGKFSQMFSKTPRADTETRLFVQISWNLADRKSVKSRVI